MYMMITSTFHLHHVYIYTYVGNDQIVIFFGSKLSINFVDPAMVFECLQNSSGSFTFALSKSVWLYIYIKFATMCVYGI